MVEIRPFYGWRYNPERVRLEEVLAPPYDVVSAEEQAQFLAQSPFNVFHLELGPILETDHEQENRYTRAKGYWDKWRKEGILIREERPALYLYRLHFTFEGRHFIRRGFIGLVRLEAWENKKVLPHEKTFDRVTEDRLRLLRATRAQFSQIFCLYHDKDLISLEVLEARAERLFSVKDRDGFEHELLRVTSEEAFSQVEDVLRKGPLYIADGHHRYTTALRFMKEMEEIYGESPPRCFHYMMMYLCPFEEPGLLVLPTHRLIELPFEKEEVLRRLKSLGEVRPLLGEDLSRALKGLSPHQFLVLHNGESFLFELKAEHLARLAEKEKVGRLPVAIFTEVLREAFGLDEALLKEQGKLLYTPWVEEVRKKACGKAFGFLLAKTPLSALEEVARASLVMPHKSTYFHPKILTGMVFFEISPEKGPPC